MRRPMCVRLLAAVICLSAAVSAQAQAIANGDVFASIGFGVVGVYGPDGTPKLALDTGVASQQTTGSAFDAAGNFYVTNFVGGQIFKFDVNGVLQSSFVTGGDSPESIVFDASGNMYVGHANGPNNQIRKFTAAGAALGTFAAAIEGRGTDWVEVAPDQKTLYYTSEGVLIKRYDVSTNTQLTDFANLGVGPAYALRLLPDGGLLVADSVNIKRLDTTGAIVLTYDVAVPVHDNWFSLNLDPDHTSFWSGDFITGMIHKFDIASGAHLATIDTGFPNTLFGVSVFGEPTQGLVPPAPPKPAATTLVTSGMAQFYGNSAFTATLTAGGAPVAGATIAFTLRGSPVGTAVTDANGVATLPGTGAGSLTGGLHVGVIGATFAGDASFAAASAIGDLLITKATSTITWPQPAPIVFGTKLSSLQLNAKASFSGPLFYDPPIGTVLPVGTQTLSVYFLPNDGIDYSDATATVTIQVLPATTTTGGTTTTTNDTVNVTRDEYTSSDHTLRVEAASTSATATLQVFVTSSGALIGTLTNAGGGKYKGQFSWPVNPQTVTVRSSQNGSATSNVLAK
jgi:hypothetical protein